MYCALYLVRLLLCTCSGCQFIALHLLWVPIYCFALALRPKVNLHKLKLSFALLIVSQATRTTCSAYCFARKPCLAQGYWVTQNKDIYVLASLLVLLSTYVNLYWLCEANKRETVLWVPFLPKDGRNKRRLCVASAKQ